MKPRWLLLGVSVICLLALFPAAALSQGRRVHAGCGTATIDGQAWPAEWANAGKVNLVPMEENGAVVESPIPLPEVGASLADDVSGELWVMNDANRFYMATTLALDQTRIHPDWWMGWMHILFTDEGNALDGQWDAPDCGPPLPGEGWVWVLKGLSDPESDDFFMPDSRAGGCYSQPLVGVRWAGEPDRSIVFEYSFDLQSSELDNVGPGDCFRLGLWTMAYGCEWGSGCTGGGNWMFGTAQWPGSFMFTPDTFGTVCLDLCEVDFVPEPGSILLLGSGLAGLAGYATLRLRSGQALRGQTRE
jgi:hypothetical protein